MTISTRAIQGNVAMQVMQTGATGASGASWWLNLQSVRVASSGGEIVFGGTTW